MPSKPFCYGTPEIRWDGRQTTIDHPPKDILDITAGYRSMWKTYKKYLPSVSRVLFLDRRPEVKPDVLGNNENLSRFADGSFNIVVYDPPHFIQLPKNTYYKTEFGKRFWAFPNMTLLLKNLHAVNREVARVLKPDGTLILKWTELFDGKNPSRYSAVQYLSNFEEFDRRIFASKSGHNKHNELSLTWLKKIGG